MRNRLFWPLVAGLVALALVLGATLPAAHAASPGPAQVAESVRADLLQAQLAIGQRQEEAQRLVAAARATYERALSGVLAQDVAAVHAQILQEFARADEAVQQGDGLALADARAQLWTALLAGAYQVVEAELTAGHAQRANDWLALREFRRVTRLTRVSTDATKAVQGALAGTTPVRDAVAAVKADLLDTYQARLTQILGELQVAADKRFLTRQVESAALAAGYFEILAPAYEKQRGATELAGARQTFAELRLAARTNTDLPAALARVQALLSGFRAAPLPPAEQAKRAGQLARYLALVPVEYGRGVQSGQVIKAFEIQEAIAFANAAAGAFADLQSVLQARDAATTAKIAAQLALLDQELKQASSQSQVAEVDAVKATVAEIQSLLTQAMPAEWQQHDSAGDFDVISSLLDQVEQAVATGQYEMAESARLEAYAVLETGPEARLVAFAPQSIPVIEGLFWYGNDAQQGLARLLLQRAPLAAIQATREALEQELAKAQEALTGSSDPFAIGTNAAIIVIREGLEAVLILASLMASLGRPELRHLRRPMWVGSLGALAATVLTWLLARGVLAAFARYGEKLEAILSVIAIGVLLLITNWFFHKTYWNDWLANFHKKKKQLLGVSVGQWVGLATLGFTSIYREGFETVLFLQALVVEGGPKVVLLGVGAGMALVLLVGIALFSLQVRLPYKRMLIVTGVLIGMVLMTMVGNTVHVFQLIGWMPLHPIRSLHLPYWAGRWFGLFPTYEGLCLQLVACLFVIGSYYLAEWMRKRETSAPAVQA
jgi:high-affinity iron transporter